MFYPKHLCIYKKLNSQTSCVLSYVFLLVWDCSRDPYFIFFFFWICSNHSTSCSSLQRWQRSLEEQPPPHPLFLTCPGCPCFPPRQEHWRSRQRTRRTLKEHRIPWSIRHPAPHQVWALGHSHWGCVFWCRSAPSVNCQTSRREQNIHQMEIFQPSILPGWSVKVHILVKIRLTVLASFSL